MGLPPPPVRLYGEAAINFLESIGVELFESTLSIDDVVYDGSYGEQILAENGVHLYEDGIIIEGKMADFANKTRQKASDTTRAMGRKFADKADRYIYDKAAQKHENIRKKMMADLDKQHSPEDYERIGKKYASKNAKNVRNTNRGYKTVDRVHRKIDNVAYMLAPRRTMDEVTIFSDIEII